MFDSSLTKLRHRLLCRIGRRYRVVSEEVKFGGLSFPFTRIADPDSVLDEVAAEADLRDRLAGSPAPDDQLHLPYWAELWESARGVGAYLVGMDAEGGVVDAVTRGHGDAERGVVDAETRRRADAGKKRGDAIFLSPRPRVPASPSLATPASPRLAIPASSPSVLDLGCGMGMAGTVAAALGAKVLFADLEPPALLFAQLNSLPWRDRVRTRRLNWQRDSLHERFNVILGADILYERVQWDFLEPFWRAHLSDGGHVLLGEPGRQTGDMFVEWIIARGWNLTTTEIPVATRPKPIRIFRISRQ